MTVSAAERDGVRDDELFSFALKSLARMGRLDLSMRVNEIRERYFFLSVNIFQWCFSSRQCLQQFFSCDSILSVFGPLFAAVITASGILQQSFRDFGSTCAASVCLRYLDDGELEYHDRMTTAGLAVACLRAGDEASGLEIFESAIKPGKAAMEALAAAAAAGAGAGVGAGSATFSGRDGVRSEALHGQRGQGEEEEEEEDWELLEAEEEQEDILEAEGEVLPELLGYYLERVEKERSQEAATGVSFAWGGVRAV